MSKPRIGYSRRHDTGRDWNWGRDWSRNCGWNWDRSCAWILACAVLGVLSPPRAVTAQTVTYRLHREASSVSGVLRLRATPVDAAAYARQTGNLGTLVDPSRALLGDFLTDAGVPGLTGTLAPGQALSLRLYARKTADFRMLFLSVEIRLNHVTGPTVCIGSSPGPLTTSTALTGVGSMEHLVPCMIRAAVPLTSGDRFFLRVSTWVIGTPVGQTVKGQLWLEGTTAPTYDATMTVPLPVPIISGLTPPSGGIGTNVTIAGSNFGSGGPTSTVTFNGVAATPVAWTPTSVTVSVPAGATTGPVVVTAAGLASNGVPFTVPVPSPSLSGLVPAAGPVGTSVTLTGTNFGDIRGTSSVWFGAVSATPTSWNATAITVPVPVVAPGPAPVVVRVAGIDSPAATFTVSDCTPHLTPSTVSLPVAGDTGTLNLTTGVGCAWASTTAASWIVLPTPAGTGAATLGYTVTANPTSTARTATVNIGSAVVTVTQAGNGAPPPPPPGPVPGPDPAPVPPEPSAGTAIYYHADAVGSVRMITNQAGAVVARHDYLPFGTEVGTPPTAPGNRRFFTGQERDGETASGTGWQALDYFGARSYQSQQGRFISPDPITANALRIVDPQRWNRYGYAVNNPLRYNDPDGQDVLLVNYTDGANGFGHVGILALNADGSGLYGGFNPANAGSFTDVGSVKNKSFPAGSVAFGAGGRPTIASISALREQLAKLDGKSPQAIRIRHIKTSAAETAALTDYIRSNINAPSRYVAGVNDCLDFCVRGLEHAGVPAPAPSAILGGAIPDLYFKSFLLDSAIRLAESPTPGVETSFCTQGIDCR